MADELTVSIEAFGIDPRCDRAQVARGSCRRRISRRRQYRLLHLYFVEPVRKSARRPQLQESLPRRPLRLQHNRAVFVEGCVDDPERVTVTDAALQPLPMREEFEAAIDIVREDWELASCDV